MLRELPWSAASPNASVPWRGRTHPGCLDYGEDANLALILPFLGDVELHRHPNRRYRIHEDSTAEPAEPFAVRIFCTVEPAPPRLTCSWKG